MSSSTLRPGVEVFTDSEPLVLSFADVAIESPRLAYEFVGPVDAPIVVVLGGISAGSHVCSHELNREPGWWEQIVGSGRAIDTSRVRVLGIDWFGGAGASTGPEGGETFPPVTSHDQARLLCRFLDSIGGDSFAAIVGSSYGGMVALAFAELFEARVDRIAVLCAAHESDPWTSGVRSIGRRVLELAKKAPELTQDLVSIARGLGMLTYRTPREFRERFSSAARRTDEGRARFEVEGYLEARGAAFAADFSPEAVFTLSEAIDLHRVNPANIRVETHVAAACSDVLVPLETVRRLVDGLAGDARLVEIDSLYGHDAFLKEVDAVREFLIESLGGAQ